MTQDKNKQIFSTQEFIAFSEIHEGVVITKNGELRVILMASSINFSLKSEQEQTAIIYAYQNFLNSLSFPVQIMMQSRQLDLSKYLGKLKKIAESQTQDLLRNQTLDYMDFIEKLIKLANIMDKKFFVVIPYTPPTMAPIGKPSFFGGKKQTATTQITAEQFTKYHQELQQRVSVIQSGLGSIGVRTAQLNTQQIVELMYGIYNPEEAAKEKLINFNHLNSDVVESELENSGGA